MESAAKYKAQGAGGRPMIALPGISEELRVKVQGFLASGKTGNITLNVKEGRILSWQFAEFGRPSDSPLDNGAKLADTM